MRAGAPGRPGTGRAPTWAALANGTAGLATPDVAQKGDWGGIIFRADSDLEPLGIFLNYVGWGAGPRGSQNLVRAAKARALLDGRTTPTAEDVRAVAVPVLRHRILTNHRAVGDGVTSRQVVDHLLKEIAA